MKILKILLPILIVAIGVGGFIHMKKTAPSAERKPQKEQLPSVEVTPLQRTDYTLQIHTQGTVSARTQSTLVAEVSGKIMSISSHFRDGGFFEPGDTLLTIDPRDYKSAVTIAKAELAQQQSNLSQEQARADLAKQDWERLGDKKKPNDLVLRLPQLEGAKASVAAAKARLEQAKTNLSRTKIIAPYAGRVLEKKVDIGQYVTPNSVLASIYAIDFAEIKLPLTSQQLDKIQLPAHYRGEKTQPDQWPKVQLSDAQGNQWEGRIVRSSGAIDTQSRQQFVVAQVDNPYGKTHPEAPPLKIGTFVTAKIEGETLENIFVVPRIALREGQDILLVKDNKLQLMMVEILWRDTNHVMIRGPENGDLLVTSPINFAVNGMKVKIHGEEKEKQNHDQKASTEDQ